MSEASTFLREPGLDENLILTLRQTNFAPSRYERAWSPPVYVEFIAEMQIKTGQLATSLWCYINDRGLTSQQCERQTQ